MWKMVMLLMLMNSDTGTYQNEAGEYPWKYETKAECEEDLKVRRIELENLIDKINKVDRVQVAASLIMCKKDEDE